MISQVFAASSRQKKKEQVPIHDSVIGGVEKDIEPQKTDQTNQTGEKDGER